MSNKGQLAKWGNSLAVRIPKDIAEAAAMKEGDVVVLDVESAGSIAVRAAKRPASLKELVESITAKNLHQAADWGAPQGNEEW